jgi:hypothetical protein
VQAFASLAHRHRQATLLPQQQTEVDRKCHHQIDQTLFKMEDVMAELYGELEAECHESLAQAHLALENIKSKEDGAITQALQALDESLYTLDAAETICRDTISKLSRVLQQENIPEHVVQHLQNSLIHLQRLEQEVQQKHGEIAKNLNGNPQFLTLKAQLTSDKIDNKQDQASIIDAIRRDRKALLSRSKTRRHWANLKFKKADTALSPRTRQFLRYFFFALQVGAPIAAAFSSRVGKLNQADYLKLMAKASSETRAVPYEQSYEYYLEKARSLGGVDDEWLTNYDLYLRHQLIPEYQVVENSSVEPFSQSLPIGEGARSSNLPRLIFLKLCLDGSTVF